MNEPKIKDFLSVPREEWVCDSLSCFAFRDRFPVSPGHTLIVTKRIVPDWFYTSPDEQEDICAMIDSVVYQLEKNLHPKPDGYNIGFNCGAAAGQTVMHLHVHVIPRYHGDVEDPRGGVRHVIPSKANYLKESP